MSELLGLTPSQTVGPYLHIGLLWDDGPYVVPEGTPGAVRIFGQVFDGNGAVVPDAMVETWQADPDGRFNHPGDPRGAAVPAVAGFRGFGRATTVEEGRWSVLTLKPGPLPAFDPEDPDAMEAPHLDVTVMSRGLLNRVVTRIYFSDEEAANAADPVLAIVDPERRSTLVAVAEDGGYRFDIHLQGEHETVFFAV